MAALKVTYKEPPPAEAAGTESTHAHGEVLRLLGIWRGASFAM
jgi:hypothetical protein